MPEPTNATAIAVDVLAETDAGHRAATVLVVESAVAEVTLGARLLFRETGTSVGSLGSAQVEDAFLQRVQDVWQNNPATTSVLAEANGVKAHIEFHNPVPELIIVGAGHIAAPMCEMAAVLGYRVVVLDDRPAFATVERFPKAHVVSTIDFDDPFAGITLHPLTFVVLVTRGHRYDYECLTRLLRMDAAPFYIGMIGSRRRVRATHEQLKNEGFTPEQMRQVRAPVGLDLAGQTPAEIALSVLAEMTMKSHNGTGAPLSEKEDVVGRFFKNG